MKPNKTTDQTKPESVEKPNPKSVLIPPSLQEWFKPQSTLSFYQQFNQFQPDLDGLIAVGGNLSTETLLEAYAKGIFPWYKILPIKWFSPFWRAIFPTDDFKISKSFGKFLKHHPYQISFDQSFKTVVELCASVDRKNQFGTWITREMKLAYLNLFRLGVAHSVEVYRTGNLVGGLYGISLGRTFFGESMFSLEKNTSKLALYHLFLLLKKHQFHFIDAQLPSEHLMSLGAKKINRSCFLEKLNLSNQFPTLKGNWNLLPY